MSRGISVYIAILVILATFSFISGSVSADNSLITDISWPNCNTKASDVTTVGIVGVNGGLDYSHNPCLSSETQLFRNQYALYLNTGYPGISYGIKFASYPDHCKATQYLCLAYNYGYNDAVYSIKYASEQNAHSFVWWLDVESDNSWTNSYKQNREALIGMVSAIDNNTLMPVVGFYSYPGQWKAITKGWHNNYPPWVASASSSKNIAMKYCSTSFNGEPVWLSQFTTKLDYNYSCQPQVINNFKIK